MIIKTGSVAQTREIGARLANAARPGDVYGLIGDLGAGKTEFVRGFVLELDPGAAVKSPSFSLLNIYETSNLPVYHFDFYRLKGSAELGEIGFREYVCGDGVCLVEWAGMFPGELPAGSTRLIRFHDDGGTLRRIEFDGDIL